MSILKVDTINEKTTGNGVAIPGHVIQVKYYQSPTGSSGETMTTSTSYVASGVLLDFTPKFASSLIIVKAVVHVKNDSGNTTDGIVLAIYKDGTTRLGAGSNGDAFEYNAGVANHNEHKNVSMVVSETAGNTTSRQYRVYYRSFGGNSSGLNYDWGNQTMTVMEIAQ